MRAGKGLRNEGKASMSHGPADLPIQAEAGPERGPCRPQKDTVTMST
jgi:hypothetical protein